MYQISAPGQDPIYESELSKVLYLVRFEAGRILRESDHQILACDFPRFLLSGKAPEAVACQISVLKNQEIVTIAIQVQVVVSARVVSKDPGHAIDTDLSRINLPLAQVRIWRDEVFHALGTMMPINYPVKLDALRSSTVGETPFSWLVIEF